jgi:hypothetical protein
VRRLISRIAVLALSAAVALGAAAVPCAAGDTAATRAGGTLVRLSPASRQALAATAMSRARRVQAANAQTTAPATSGSFFKSTRGKVTLALMAAGTGFAVYSAHHDRIPVKSPIR